MPFNEAVHESPVGQSFMESSVGQSLAGRRTGSIVIMSWYDEAIGTYWSNDPEGEGPQNYAADVASFLALPESIRNRTLIVLQQPADIAFPGRWEGLFPSGVDPPEFLTLFRQVVRSPTLADNQDAFRAVYGGERPPKWIDLIVDGSGSMTVNTINPGFSQFEDWLRAEYLDTQINRIDDFTQRFVRSWVESLERIISAEGP